MKVVIISIIISIITVYVCVHVCMFEVSDNDSNTSRPAIAGIPRCKNITAKSVHLTSILRR